MDRKTASPVIRRYWKSIEDFDRKYAETGDYNYLNQMNGLKKQVLEIMAKVKENE